MNKELIVTFCHSNYFVKDGGTEKFVIELSAILQHKGYSHLCFFPFVKQRSIRGREIVGIIYNDKFDGIVESDRMPEVISYYLNKYKLTINSFHIQHLKHHNINDIEKTIKGYDANVFLFIHDFFIMCISEHLIDSNGSFCGNEPFSEMKCANCKHNAEGIIHTTRMEKFLQSIINRIDKVICPSRYVKNAIKKMYPDLSMKAIVRPHLVFSDETLQSEQIDKVRIAFVGRKVTQKGYDKWLKVMEHFRDIVVPDYEYYYLGIDIEEDQVVKNVYVSTAMQGTSAMRKAIADNRVNCAFLWPQCPETYGFVFYELLMSGAFIITNNESGNIFEEVDRLKNGISFATLDNCIRWMRNSKEVLTIINEYRKRNKIPNDYYANQDISMLVSKDNNKSSTVVSGRKKTLLIHSLLYRIKFRKYNF